MVTGNEPYRKPYWRFGFSRLWGKKVSEADYTVLPWHDEVGQEIATIFPEYDHDAGTAELFEFLFSVYDKMPSRADMLRKAWHYVCLAPSSHMPAGDDLKF